MKKPLLVILLSVFMYGVGLAQPRASFTSKNLDSTSCTGVPARVIFTNTSMPSSSYPIIKAIWNFSDGSTANALSSDTITHIYTQPGIYTVLLVVSDTIASSSFSGVVIINSLSVNVSHQILATPECDAITESHTANVNSTAVGDSLLYLWSANGYVFNYPQPRPVIVDTIHVPVVIYAQVTVSSKYGNTCTVSDTFAVATSSPITPTNGSDILTANHQCIENNGWINYYYDNKTPNDETDDILVLSLKPNGNDIGTIGDGTLSVSTIATPGAGSNSGILLTNPLISNQSGFWVMNRYWQVTPTHQPKTPVGVRFYFSKQDIADVNGSYPTHDLNVTDLIFYKTHGGNPDPTSNLEGAQYITSLTYDPNVTDTLHWKEFAKYTYGDGLLNSLDKHVAEFQVSSFSGGGGGATGNGQVLPVQLTSFTATNNGNKVNLQWTTAQEINVSKYNVQVSADGRQFTTLGTVTAHGKTSPDTYTFSYNETKLAQAYYRLQIVEKNGTESGSQVVPLSFVRANNSITLYPNPAKNSVQLKAVGFENKQVTAIIYNAAGIKVSATGLYFTAGAATLNTASLASGHYTVALRDEKSVSHLSLIIVAAKN